LDALWDAGRRLPDSGTHDATGPALRQLDPAIRAPLGKGLIVANHILYIPWSVGGSDFDPKVDHWIDHAGDGDLKHNKAYYKVNHGDGTDLSKLLWHSEIYVRGHGAPGDHEIDADVNGGSPLRYDEVAKRLKAQGLKKTWSGVIKLYNCNSGMPSLGSQCFAAKFAQYMRFDLGYNLISYVGYTGIVRSRYSNENGAHKNMHKFVTRFQGTVLEHKVKSKWGKVFF
jgi:hypothetical protein